MLAGYGPEGATGGGVLRMQALGSHQHTLSNLITCFSGEIYIEICLKLC